MTERLLGYIPSGGIKLPVKAATNAEITLAGLQIIDGYSTTYGDRVLVKNQTTKSENGIYIVSLGLWERASDWNDDRDAWNGMLVLDENREILYRAVFNGKFNVGSTAVSFLAQAGELIITNNSVFDITEYGAIGDGEFPCNEAIKTTVAAIINAGGGILYIPEGKFRIANSINGVLQEQILVSGKNITVQGTGDGSILFLDDRAGEGRCDMMRFENCENITLSDFKVLGTASDFVKPTDFSQCLTGSNINRLRVLNVAIESVHNMAMTLSSATDVLVSGCRLKNVVRDGYRFTAGRNIRIIGNFAENVTDDVVAVHSIDSTRYAEDVVVQGNIFRHCQSMKFLGAKNVIVDSNIMDRGIRTGVWIANNEATEGNTNIMNIKITNNIFLNFFSVFGTNSIINILGRDVTANGDGDFPAWDAVPYNDNYTNSIVDNSLPIMPFQRIEIRGNTFARTLPSVSDYSEYGYGQFFDRVTEAFGTPTTSYFRTQDITDSDFNTYAINMDAPIREIIIDDNEFNGHRLAAIRAQCDDYGLPLAFETFTIRDNTFTNTGSSSGFIVWLEDASGGTFGDSCVPKITGNTFNGDPYFVSAGHNADNTWVGDDSLTAIGQSPTNFLSGVIISDNEFKNVSQTGILTSANARVTEDNIIYADYISGTTDPSNKGVRTLPEAGNNIIVKIDGDPTSSTFMQVSHFPETSAVEADFPLTGFWPYGHFIRNRAPSTKTDPSSGLYVVSGWVKLATNSTGTVNTTDGFAELRNFIQNVAP